MKNLISVALALIMAFSLAACGGSARLPAARIRRASRTPSLPR